MLIIHLENKVFHREQVYLLQGMLWLKLAAMYLLEQSHGTSMSVSNWLVFCEIQDPHYINHIYKHWPTMFKSLCNIPLACIRPGAPCTASGLHRRGLIRCGNAYQPRQSQKSLSRSELPQSCTTETGRSSQRLLCEYFHVKAIVVYLM